MGRKRKPINQVIRGTVYPFDVMFSFGESDETLVKRLKRYHVQGEDEVLETLDENPSVRGRTVMFSSNQVCCRLNFIPETPSEIAMLQHEIFHVVEFLFRQIGMPLDDSSSEAYAYLIGFYTQEAHRLLKTNQLK